MKAYPTRVGKIHFCGIGGIGMSGIAEILHDMDYKIQGSDTNTNNNVKRLQKKGIKIFSFQKSSNIRGISFLIISTAIKQDNPELLEARKKNIPVVHRSEMLGELMKIKWSIAIAGSHGKTTSTSLIATIFEKSNLDPTVINGGIISSWGSNAKLGKSNWLIAEADESDGSFEKLNPTIAVVTNIDPEHLDYYESFENLQKAFLRFISSIPFYGFIVLCIDHPNVRKLIPLVKDRKVITYGINESADIKASNIQNDKNFMYFDVSTKNKSEKPTKFKLPMLGIHNVRNCLASVAIATEIGIKNQQIVDCLYNFKGVGRRFDIKWNKNGITVVDDYAHHPEEIKVTLSAAKLRCPDGKIIAIFQPHRYSRLKELFSDFCKCFYDANHLFIADVYAAGEKEIFGYNRANLVKGIINEGHLGTYSLKNPANLASQLKKIIRKGDLIILLGAGSITNWANDLVEKFKNLRLE